LRERQLSALVLEEVTTLQRSKQYGANLKTPTGIGYELAKCCAQEGFDLVVVADEPEINTAGKDFETLSLCPCLPMFLPILGGSLAIDKGRRLPTQIVRKSPDLLGFLPRQPTHVDVRRRLFNCYIEMR
jgi:hypothetical protein